MSHSSPIFVLGKKVELFQPAYGFRTSLDSVMLAAACTAEAGENVLDLGCGVGGAGLCVLYRVPDTQLTGVELQESHVNLAIQNAAHNDMAERAQFVHSDIRTYKGERYNHVICNPPYMEAGHHLVSPHEEKAQANGHQDETLTVWDWLEAAHRNLKSGGSFTIIHRADMADKIIAWLHGPKKGRRFGAVEVIPLWPKAGRQAKRVIIRALKDRQSPAILHPGLVLHEEDGSYTAGAEKILRGAAAIS